MAYRIDNTACWHLREGGLLGGGVVSTTCKRQNNINSIRDYIHTSPPQQSYRRTGHESAIN
eukprot:scaffold266866_cov28-Tisochrysis_lutea.AAC.1